MEKQIQNQREKLVISFSGCSKNDKGNHDKKDNANDRINSNQGIHEIKNSSGHAKHLSSELSYKF